MTVFISILSTGLSRRDFEPMSIKDLIAVVPPPVVPPRPVLADEWKEAERRLDTALPEDYKELMGVYGSGIFLDFLWAYSPVLEGDGAGLLVSVDRTLSAFRSAGDDMPIGIPLYPERGGLLPWGKTDNGDVLGWRTQGPPEKWSVIVFPARDHVFQEFKMSMTSFLAGIVSGRLACRFFPPLERDSRLFIPGRNAT